MSNLQLKKERFVTRNRTHSTKTRITFINGSISQSSKYHKNHDILIIILKEPPCSQPFKKDEEPSRKRLKLEMPLKKQTPFQKLLANTPDRVKYDEPNPEVAFVINGLIERVGMKIDLENFERKIKDLIGEDSYKQTKVEDYTIVSLLYKM